MKTRLEKICWVVEGFLRALIVLSFFSNPFAAQAAWPANDNASDGSYTNSSATWTNGSNGGTGWKKWSLTPSVSGPTAGFTNSSSTANGSPGIDTNAYAWWMYANAGQTNLALRFFTNNVPLSVGQVFNIEMAPGPLDVNGTNGVELLNGSLAPVLQIFLTGDSYGVGTFSIADKSGTNAHTGPYAFTNGVQVSFTLTNQDAGVVALSDGVTPFEVGVLLIPQPSLAIVATRLFGYSTGTGTNFFNNLLVDCGTFPTNSINPLPPGPVCSNAATVFTGAIGYDNLWAVSNNACGAAIVGSTNSATVSVFAGNCSTFDLYLTISSNGCTQVWTNSFSTTGPNSSITAPATVCASSIGNTASVPNAGVGATYIWTISAGSTIIAGAGTRTITFTAGASGSAVLNCTVTSSAGCSSGGTQNQTVSISVPPVSTITAAAAVCPSASGNSATVPDAGVGATYAWTISAGSTITAGAGTRAITYTAAASGNVVLNCTITSGLGCPSGGAQNQTVTITALPNSTITAPAAVCASSGGNAASVPDAGVGATYAWSISGGASAITGGAGTRAITFTADAAIPAVLNCTVSSSIGCSSGGAQNQTVTILALPPTNIAFGQPSCSNSPNTVSVSTAGPGATYIWTINNATISGAVNTNVIQITAGNSGAITAQVTVVNAAGCTASGGPTPAPIYGEPLTASPTNVAFRAYVVDGPADFTSQSEPYPVKLVNVASGPVTITSVVKSGVFAGDYTLVTDPTGAVLPSGGSTNVTIVFKPNAQGDRSANLVITTDSPCYPILNIPLSGSGKTCPVLDPLPPGAVGYALATFGDVSLVQAGQTKYLIITNNGPTEMVIGGGAQLVAEYPDLNPHGIKVVETDGGNCNGQPLFVVGDPVVNHVTGTHLGGAGTACTNGWDVDPLTGIPGQGTIIPPGATCSIPITFWPCSSLVTGKYSATVTFAGDFCSQDPAQFATHEISFQVKGQATAPLLQILEPGQTNNIIGVLTNVVQGALQFPRPR